MTSNEEKIVNFIDEMIEQDRRGESVDIELVELKYKIISALHSQKERVVEMCETGKFPDYQLDEPWKDGYNAGLSDLKTKIEGEL